MTVGTDKLKTAWRDNVTQGIPATGVNEPNKGEIRAALDALALDIAAAGLGDLAEAEALLTPLVDQATTAATQAAASAAIMATVYTKRLDETATENLYSTSPARYGYGTHRDFTEIANGKLVGRIDVGLRPSANASVRLDVYERPLTATGVNTTAPGRHASDVLVGTATLTFAASGAVIGANGQVSFVLTTPFLRRDGYTYGLDPRFVDGSGVAIVTGVAAIAGTYADRKALFYRTATPNTWALTTSYTMAVDAFEAETATGRDPTFKGEVAARQVTDTKVAAIQSSLTGWFVPTYAAVNEGAYYQTGNGALVNNPNYNSVKYAITGGEQQIRFTAIINGGSTGIICFNAAGTYLGVRFQGTSGADATYVNQLIDIAGLPGGTASIAVDGLSSSPISLEIYQARTDIANAVSQMALAIALLQSGSGGGKWAGLHFMWFGTSIPAGFGGYGAYPQLVAAALGATVSNFAISSSCIRRGIKSRENVLAGDYLGLNGRGWQAGIYALMQTSAEKEDLIANWETKWRDMLVGAGKPTTLDANTQALIRASSYEVRLQTPADAYFIDHGHNDVDSNLGTDAAKIADMSDTTSTAPGQTRERGLYLGATMALIDAIRAINPRAKIFLVGHYENDRKAWIYQAQNVLAEIIDLPICRLWERLGWTQQVLTGGAAAGKTITQERMLDDVHPGSDPTGKAPREIADSLTAWLGTV